MKVNLTDVPDAIAQVLYRCRQGWRKVLDDKILQISEPETIDVSFEVMIRKDDLTRVETSVRGPSVSTTVTGPQTSTSTRSGAGSTTVSTETSTTNDSSAQTGGEVSSDAGSEGSTETGAESGSSSSTTAHTSSDGGGELEIYNWEADTAANNGPHA